MRRGWGGETERKLKMKTREQTKEGVTNAHAPKDGHLALQHDKCLFAANVEENSPGYLVISLLNFSLFILKAPSGHSFSLLIKHASSPHKSWDLLGLTL